MAVLAAAAPQAQQQNLNPPLPPILNKYVRMDAENLHSEHYWKDILWKVAAVTAIVATIAVAVVAAVFVAIYFPLYIPFVALGALAGAAIVYKVICEPCKNLANAEGEKADFEKGVAEKLEEVRALNSERFAEKLHDIGIENDNPALLKQIFARYEYYHKMIQDNVEEIGRLNAQIEQFQQNQNGNPAEVSRLREEILNLQDQNRRNKTMAAYLRLVMGNPAMQQDIYDLCEFNSSTLEQRGLAQRLGEPTANEFMQIKTTPQRTSISFDELDRLLDTPNDPDHPDERAGERALRDQLFNATVRI